MRLTQIAQYQKLAHEQSQPTIADLQRQLEAQAQHMLSFQQQLWHK